MAAWNTGIFDNDTALNCVDDLEKWLRCKLRNIHPNRYPVVQQRLIEMQGHILTYSKQNSDYHIIIFCALIMQNGAILTDDLRTATLNAISTCQEQYFYQPAKDEITDALTNYQNLPWGFAGKDLIEVINHYVY